MKKSVGTYQNAQAFLMIELWVATLFSVLIHPVRSQVFFFPEGILYAGAFVGLVFAAMLYFLGKALEHGPCGLTIAGLNSSNVLPTVFLFFLFGPQRGFQYTLLHFIGSCFVVCGILWATKNVFETKYCSSWVIYSLLAIVCHVFFFICMEWRSWMVRYPDTIATLRLLSQKTAENAWFVPIIYCSAAIFHTLVFLQKQLRFPSSREYFLGVFGGVFNALYAGFLLRSTETASCLEHAMLFPFFSVVTIFLCNIWGKYLYQENIDWKPCSICFLGIFLGTVDWESISIYWKFSLF